MPGRHREQPPGCRQPLGLLGAHGSQPVDRARRIVAHIQRAVRANQDAVRISSQRYTAGRASYFEVLQAQQQLYPAEEALAQAKRDQYIAIVRLYMALGGGWNLNGDFCQAADRLWGAPERRSSNFGFRLARVPVRSK